ncbi:MAG: hypothetical protein IJ470_02610 [Clostridia bacterium]|nr:hypothetical protein [Clostridia bacterium]
MASNCEYCSHYVYDEDYDGYICLVDMDEDDYIRFISRGDKDCPFFRADDEYKIVRRQN